MRNFQCKKIFIESLEELIREELTLYQSLMILSESRMTNQKIRKTAGYLSSEIEKGNSLSGALRTCEYIRFEKNEIDFFSFSEHTGNILTILSFLKERNSRKEEVKASVQSALIYPFFILIVSFAVLTGLLLSDSRFWGSSGFFGIQKSAAFQKIIVSFSFTFLVSLFLICLIKRISEESRLYEAFLAAGFLTQEGLSFASAVGFAAAVSDFSTPLGNAFLKVKEKLEFGVDTKTAFSQEFGKKVCSFRTKEKIERALYLARETGNKDDVLMRIAASIKQVDEKRRKAVLLLVEPVFILAAGGFLFSVTVKLFLPVFSGYGIM